MAPSITIYWGGNIVNGVNGVGYVGGMSRNVAMERELYYYGALLGIIRDAIGPNRVINRIGFRNPMLSQDGSFVFGLVEIYDDASMGHMYRVMRQFPTLQLIQLFVEVDTYGTMPSQTQFEGGSCSDLLRSVGAAVTMHENVDTGDHQSFPEDDEEDEEEDDEEDEEEDDEDDDDVEQEDEEEDDEDEDFYDDESNDDGDEQNLAQVPSSEDDLFDQYVQNASRSPDYSAYHSVSIDDMVNDSRMRISNDEVWHAGLEFKIGMIFSSRDHVKTAVKLYSVKRKREFRAEETRHNTIAVRCHVGEGCQWRLRATEKKSSGYWTITKYGGPHTCVRPSDRVGIRNLDSELISAYVSALIEKQPNIQVGALKNDMAQRFGVEPSYKRVWKAKQKAINQNFGDWEENFNELCPFLNAATYFNSGSCWDVEHDEVIENNSVVPNVGIFRRMFCAYKPCIEAFKHCRPVLCVDETFFYGKYKMCLLTAEAVDGDDRIFPVAFAVVHRENNDNWEYFLNLLRYAVVDEHPCPNDVCIISDHHKGIIHAMQSSLWVNNPHRFCIRHIASNYNSRFKNEHLKNIVEKLGN